MASYHIKKGEGHNTVSIYTCMGIISHVHVYTSLARAETWAARQVNTMDRYEADLKVDCLGTRIARRFIHSRSTYEKYMAEWQDFTIPQVEAGHPISLQKYKELQLKALLGSR